VLASVRPLLGAERFLSNTLLGTDIAPVAIAPRGDGRLDRLKAYWSDRSTWRGMAYLLARFPVGLLTFCIVVSVFSTAGYLISAPIAAPFDGVELGIWEPDTWYEGLALVPAGLLLLVAAGWISEGMAALSREFARWGVR
jgi:putative sensor protein